MKSLLETFNALDDGLKENLADITSPRILSFIALQIAHEQCGIERLSAEHISACLETAGVALKKIAVVRALASARSYVSSSRNDGEVFYKLMTKGKRIARDNLQRGCISVVRIEHNQPRTARLELKKVFSALSGVVRICDPYYGIRTLDSLDCLSKTCTVKFLTQKTNEAGRKLTGALKDFKKERPNTEIRIASKASGIHDRYVVTRTDLLILGHGLKDIGGKESFLVKLDSRLTPDLVNETISAFESRWKLATTFV